MSLPAIPLETKKHLLAIASRMPSQRAGGVFVREALTLLGNVLQRYPRTVSYATAGFLVGVIVDHLPVIGWATGGLAKYIGGALGAGIGLGRDADSARMIRAIERDVLVAVQLAVERALEAHRAELGLLPPSDNHRGSA